MTGCAYSVHNATKDSTDEVNNCINKCFCDPISFNEILGAGSSQGHMVAHTVTKRGKFCGFGVCQIRTNCVVIIVAAVLPQHRRRGAARLWLQFVEHGAAVRSIPFVVAAVSETSLDSLLFLKACGYRAVAVDRDVFQESRDHDGSPFVSRRDRIVFVKHVAQPDPQEQSTWVPDRARRLLDVLQTSGMTNRY